MISIIRATENEVNSIVNIGKISVEEAHRDSSPKEALNQYLEKNYTVAAIQEELSNTQNIYHIIQYNENAVGFSNGCAELAPKKPPPLVPSTFIASCDATGPIGRVCFTPSNVVMCR